MAVDAVSAVIAFLHSLKFMCFIYVLANNSQSKSVKTEMGRKFWFENEGILGTLQPKEKCANLSL